MTERVRGMRASVLALVVVLAIFSGRSDAQTVTSLAVLVDQVRGLFPILEGEVIEVKDRTITLSVGRRDGLQGRVRLFVYRDGREIRHPRTGELLGRAEQPVGQATLVEIFEGYSTATVSGEVPPVPGDRVRLSSGKVPLTILTVNSGVKEGVVEAALQELVSGFNRGGRFLVRMADQVNVWLREQQIGPSDFLAGKGLETAARRFEVDYLLALTFRTVDRRSYLEVRLLAPPATEPLVSSGFLLPDTLKTAAPPQGQFSSGSGRPEGPAKARSLLARLLWGDSDTTQYSAAEASIPLKEVARFGFPVLGMDVAVSPTDSVPRVAVTDGMKAWVYRLIDGKLEAEWSYSGWQTSRILSIQLADLDGDGAFELVVNSQNFRSGMGSAIIGVRDGQATPIVAHIPMILLAVDVKGDGRKSELWGQRYNELKFYTRGHAERFTLTNGKLVSAGHPRVPDTFRATGATFSNIATSASNQTARALVFIDEAQTLRVTVDGQDLWRSSSRVGGGYTNAEIETVESRASAIRRYATEPFPVSVDLDGDGVEEILVPQNQLDGSLAVAFRSAGGFRFQSVRSGFDGPITALGAIPAADGRGPILIASVVRFGSIRKTSGETRIIMTVPE